MTKSPEQTTSSQTSPKAAPLGHHAAGGALWTLIQTVGSKAIGLLAQFIIAYILDQESLGAVYEAFAIMAFPIVLQRFGITELLVQRQRRFRQLSTAGFWISAMSGFLVMLASTLLAVGVAVYRHCHPRPDVHESPRFIVALVFVCSLAYVIDGFAMLPQAKMRIDLRFARQSMIALWSNVLVGLLTIILLLFHFGPMGVILPRPLAKIYELVMSWRAAPVKVKPALDLRRWRRLLRDGTLLIFAMLCGSVVQDGDNLSVGLILGQVALGIYSFAYNLSTQTLQLLAIGLTPMLFSVFAKLSGERERQAQAFVRSAEVLALIATPFCMLQAAIAQPMLHFLYRSKWDAAVPVLQVLSIGMIFAAMTGGTLSLVQAQGRFKLQTQWLLLRAFIFAAMIIPSALKGNQFTVAAAVCLFYVISTPLGAYVAARPGHISFWRIVNIFVWPIAGSVIACAIPLLVMRGGEMLTTIIPISSFGSGAPARVIDFLTCAVIGISSLSIYVVLTAKLRKESTGTVLQYLHPLLERAKAFPLTGRALRLVNIIV